MRKSALFLSLILSMLFASKTFSAETKWTTITDEAQLGAYIFSEFFAKFYPTAVKCRARQGRLQVQFDVLPAGPDKPYHKWNATLLRPGETQAQAAARLPIKGHLEAKYQVKFGCQAAGETLLVAFRGTRALN